MQGMPVLFSIQEVSLLRCASFAFLYIVFCLNDCWAINIIVFNYQSFVVLDASFNPQVFHPLLMTIQRLIQGWSRWWIVCCIIFFSLEVHHR